MAPEVSFEIRQADFKSRFTDRGREPPATPTQRGVDTVSGLIAGSLKDRIRGTPFASVVVPVGRVRLAAYRHELANYRASMKTFGAFAIPVSGDRRFVPIQSRLDLDVVAYGASAGIQVGRSFALGFAGSLFNFDLHSSTNRYCHVCNRDDTGPGGFYGPPDYSETNLQSIQTQDGTGKAFAFSAGLLWKHGTRFQAGAVYRRGPDFANDVALANRPGPATPFPPQLRTGGLKTPDAFGAGIAIRATQRLTATVDVLRVRHSQRLDHFGNIFGIPVPSSNASDYAVDDGNEYHAGVEYIFSRMARPLAERLGGWYEPDTRIRYASDPATASSRFPR